MTVGFNRTVSGLLTDAIQQLEAAGVQEPRLDSRLLLEWTLGCRCEDLVRDPGRTVDADAASAFDDAIARRALRTPLPYIIGVQWFYGRDFVISEAVLIPRPETELLVHTALERLRGLAAPRIVDVGTGSGCIAVTLACELPNALIIATDISPAALAVARANAARHGVLDRITFVYADLLRPLDSFPEGVCASERSPLCEDGRSARRDSDSTPLIGLESKALDAVVSNPPYIALAEVGGLQREVRDFEPRLALTGWKESTGTDGAALYPTLFSDAARVLRDGGWIIVEVGQGQGSTVANAASESGFGEVECRVDLAGIPRVVSAVRVSDRAEQGTIRP